MNDSESSQVYIQIIKISYHAHFGDFNLPFLIFRFPEIGFLPICVYFAEKAIKIKI